MNGFPDFRFTHKRCGKWIDVLKADRPKNYGPLKCDHCNMQIGRIRFGRRWVNWIAAQYERKRLLRSNKQDPDRGNEEVNQQGFSGELAACMLLCPAFLPEWLEREKTGGSNRGCDLRKEWLGLDKDVEVKTTEYCDEHRGLLVIRTPTYVSCDAEMQACYLDDCYYLLMQEIDGKPSYRVLGWLDKVGVMQWKTIDPFGFGDSKRHHWAVHHKRLRPMHELRK
jgi:hypothetical protein